MTETLDIHTVWILLLVAGFDRPQAAQLRGDWGKPEQVYAAMVFVSLATCIAAPWVLFLLLQRWPQTAGATS